MLHPCQPALPNLAELAKHLSELCWTIPNTPNQLWTLWPCGNVCLVPLNLWLPFQTSTPNSKPRCTVPVTCTGFRPLDHCSGTTALSLHLVLSSCIMVHCSESLQSDFHPHGWLMSSPCLYHAQFALLCIYVLLVLQPRSAIYCSTL